MQNNNKVSNFINGRQIFSKIGAQIKMPYLLEHQKNSYDYFLNYGIKNAFNDNFPIVCNENGLILDFVSLSIEKQKESFLECKEKNI